MWCKFEKGPFLQKKCARVLPVVKKHQWQNKLTCGCIKKFLGKWMRALKK